MYSEGKRETVLNSFIKGEKIKKISEKENVSVQTIYNWLKESGYDEGTKHKINYILDFYRDGNYSEALAVYEETEFPDVKILHFVKTNILDQIKKQETSKLFAQKEKEARILSKKVTEFINGKEFTKGLEICNRNEFAVNETIQLQKKKLLNLLEGQEERKKQFAQKEKEAKLLSKKVTEFINNKEFSKGLEICNREEYYKNAVFQSQKITIFILKGYYKSALKICNRVEFAFDESIQKQKKKILNLLKGQEEREKQFALKEKEAKLLSKKVREFINDKEFIKGLEICNRDEYYYNAVFQSQKITILIYLKRYFEALEICNRNEFTFDESIQKQKKKILNLLKGQEERKKQFLEEEKEAKLLSEKVREFINGKEFSKGLEICNRDEFTFNEAIQLQKKNLLNLLKGQEEREKQFAEKEKEARILSKKVTEFINTKEFSKGLEICNRDEYYHDAIFQSQKITIFILKGYYKSALKICNRDEFTFNEAIQLQKKNLLNLLKGQEEREKQFAEKEKEAKLLSEKATITTQSEQDKEKIEEYLEIIFTRIYASDLTYQELNQSQLPFFEKIILTCLYYEKTNRQNGLKYLKECMKKFEFNTEQIKTLKQLTEKMKNKKAVTDHMKYAILLQTKVNMELSHNILKQKKIELEQAKEKFDCSKEHISIGIIGHVNHGKTTLTAAITKCLGKSVGYTDVDKAPNSLTQIIPTSITSDKRVQDEVSNEIYLVTTKKKGNKNSKKVTSATKVKKSNYADYLAYVKYLYCCMQYYDKRAIANYDAFTEAAEQPLENVDAKNKFDRMLSRAKEKGEI